MVAEAGLEPTTSGYRFAPVAVPGVRLGDGAPSLHADRGHSLRSLHPPPAALPSLPQRATLVGLITRMVAQGALCKPEKKKRPPGWVVFLFLVAEAGLEPTTSGL